jgi:HEAT repeat protein
MSTFSPDFSAIQELRRKGLNALEFWEYLSRFPSQRFLWENETPTGLVDSQMWAFLLKPEYQNFLAPWRKKALPETSWWEILESYPLSERLLVFPLLKKLPLPQLLPFIEKNVQDPSDKIRFRVLTLLNDQEPPPASLWKILLTLLEDSDLLIQQQIRSLNGHWLTLKEKAVPPLLEILKDPSKTLRFQTIELLTRLDTEASVAIPSLLEIFSQEPEFIKRKILMFFERLKAPEALPLVMEVLENSRLLSLHDQALSLLVYFKDIQTLPYLTEKVLSSEWQTRKTALNAIFTLAQEHPQARQVILENFHNPYSDIRQEAIKRFNLESLPRKTVVSHLLQVLRARDTLTRFQVFQKIRSFQFIEAIPLLREIVEDEEDLDNSFVRSVALEILESLTKKSGSP